MSICKKATSLIAPILLGLSLVGCMNHTYVNPSATPEAEASYSGSYHHIIFGLIDLSKEVNLEQVCPNGVAKIENKQSFVNGLVTCITGNIYSPTSVKVWCSAGGGAAAELHELNISAQGMQSIAQHSPETRAQIMQVQASMIAELESVNGAI